MATGWKNKITQQIGEHLVATELGRRQDLLATPFAGNVPMFDLLAADVRGYAVPIQVKAINGGSWQFSADTFLDIEIVDNKQAVKRKATLPNPELVCVFVLLKDKGSDEFYIFHLRDLQNFCFKTYRDTLNRTGGVRLKNPQSIHWAVSPKDLQAYRNNWELVKSSLQRVANSLPATNE